jgi:hypothetical protein
MKKVLLLAAFAIMQTTCFAQKFNGDWKGKIVYDSPKGYTEEYIFHIIDNDCSEELTRRSGAEVKEKIIEMTVANDSITLTTRKNGTFKGKLVKGQIVGVYKSGSRSFNMTLSKFGKGVINAEKNYKVDKKSGLVFY